MFKELPEGQTHSYGDSCGEPEHNQQGCPDCPHEVHNDKPNRPKCVVCLKDDFGSWCWCQDCHHKFRDFIIKQVQNQITAEMSVARSENQPTSRLTSLFNFVSEL